LAKTGPRFHEIDMLKGLACVLMLIGHTVRSRMPAPELAGKLILHVMDFSAPIFFFVSGMNVVTFVENNRNKAGFQTVKFYLSAAAVLFALGFTYNINRGSWGMMDIFQCVACGTVFTFLLMRTRLPMWAHWLIAGAVFLVPELGFRLRIESAPELAEFRHLRALIPLSSDLLHPGLREALMALSAQTPRLVRWLTFQYGPLPWVDLFYVGALCYRSVAVRKNKSWPWWAFFAVLLVGGPFAWFHTMMAGTGRSFFGALLLPTLFDMMLRGFPSYVLSTTGIAGLLYLASRALYRGAVNYRRPAARWVAGQLENSGKESFLFLILHWFLISTTLLFGHLGPAGVMINPYLRAAIVLGLTLLLVPPLARWRDRLSARPHFVGGALAFMAASLAFAMMLGGAAKTAELFFYGSYGASLAFAFVYPTIRVRLRQRCTSPATAATA
jgi:hypothetical protein